MTRAGRLFFGCCAFLAVWLIGGPGLAETLRGDALADEAAFNAVDHAVGTSDWQFGGFAESRNQFSLRDSDRQISLRQRLQFEAQWKKEAFSLFASLEGVFEGAARTWPSSHTPWRADLREVYLTYDTDNFDMFLGKKIHRWGTGDGINPMDLINPLDTRDPFSSGRADNRLPAWMLSATLSGEGVSFEGIFLPRAAVIRLPEKGEPWEPEALRDLRKGRQSHAYDLRTSHQPDRWFSDAEYGGRLSALVQGWDLSLMAFQGYIDSPVFTPRFDGTRLVIEDSYPSFTALGTSFAKSFGSQTVRGEFAFKPSYPVQGDAGLVRADLWQGVSGWDYDINGKYYLNFQYFADYRPKTERLGSDLAHGLAYEISGKWFLDALKTGFRGKAYCSGDGAMTEVFLEYELDDHWKFFTGVMWWSGKENSLLGEYEKNDMAYATVRYSF